ncbi:Hypothetical_protein [Hexamita inflata]|uniref:Hypothetical_protein n=1 Tax=Hexamita inflata TaxID=28002 RepID=A0AA86QT41_9EUKA|nr:Hypothetical protein HINF_LOCUS50232 [Hexamita inflata]
MYLQERINMNDVKVFLQEIIKCSKIGTVEVNNAQRTISVFTNPLIGHQNVVSVEYFKHSALWHVSYDKLIDLLEQKKEILQLWEVELLFLVYYVSNYILKYFATSNADDKFQQIISSWRLFMNYSLTQEGQKYDFDRIRPQSTIQSRYLIFQKGKIEITTCNKRTAMTKINAVEDVQGRSTNSLNKLRQF